MNLPAIIERELRVLGRKRSVYAVRVLFTAAILLTWAFCRGILSLSPADVLVVMSVVALILFGFGAAIAPSDAIGSERRNRTLGLLLLTPLRPLEVLFGKLFTCISQYLLCLAAILPVLALPLLGGGVEGSAVVRHFLGILVVSLLGMSIGLFASVLFRRAGDSASFSFATMLSLFLVPFFGVILIDSFSSLRGVGFLWMGPLHLALHDTGLSARYGSWTLDMIIVLCLCSGFLLSASVLFSRLWHRERRAFTEGKAGVDPRECRFVPIGDRENPCRVLRRRIGFLHPVCSGLVLLLSAAFALSVFVEGPHREGNLAFSYLVGFVLLPMVYWRCSLEAPAPVGRLRQSGMLDLIRTTPLSRRTLHSGLALMGRAPLLWNGFLLIGWNLALLAALQVLKEDDWYAPGMVAEFLIPMHLGALATIPVELLCLGAAGLWWGMSNERPLRVSAILFLSHAVLCAVLFLIPSSFSGEALVSSPFPVVVAWHVFRAVFSILILFWCRHRTRGRITQWPLRFPPPG